MDDLLLGINFSWQQAFEGTTFLFADDNLVINIADLDKDAVEAPEITNRLAVCNLDWDRVKAQDLFVLLQSFKPTGGLIKYVKVYTL